MKQNHIQIIKDLCGLLISVILSVWATCWYNQKGSITISNTSNQAINDIYVVYNGNGTEHKSWIGTIPANAHYNYRINYHNIDEGGIDIVYQDKKIDTIGYVTHYDKKHYRVNIQ